VDPEIFLPSRKNPRTEEKSKVCAILGKVPSSWVNSLAPTSNEEGGDSGKKSFSGLPRRGEESGRKLEEGPPQSGRKKLKRMNFKEKRGSEISLAIETSL